ncbi:Venom carboxylesterase-6 [Eumeta japonica]|uniref:Venom carboxylesterase-6 n=1 Tax=Eumeta variegata TaxID=151549 RepID=A0A4C1VUL7_EUMVA|nr:Venom carboxylesterase-6 [Eumeta japonica]
MIRALSLAFLLVLDKGLGQDTGDQSQVSVTIGQGTVIGARSPHGDYYEFYGIPYADSTSGSHRFKAPSTPPNFQDDFVANRRNIKCVHATSTGYEGTEDCLYLDIVTPLEEELLPVMVWIKGREFDNDLHQELSYRNLVEKDVVVVSLNYRESIFGFLCLGTEAAPGNAGLKDIIAGLRWVQNNIREFGGDPNSVTIFGHGSGAAAVDLVTLSPLSVGLVHRAIAQSGSSLAPWAISRDPLEYAVLVARTLGYEGNDPDTLSEIFTETNVTNLMQAINELDLTDNSLAFAPCIENEYVPGEAFMTYSPYKTLTERDFLQIPFIIGYVENEGTIRAHEIQDDDWLTKMDTSFSDFIQQDLEFDNEEDKLEVARLIRSFYFGEESIDMSALLEYLSYHGDTMILVSTIREALMRSAASTSSVYLYQFSYDGPLGNPFVGPLSVVGAAHSEDLAYLFNDNEAITEIDQWDEAVIDIMIERWTNFAKTGIPTSDTTTNEWQPFTPENMNFLHIFNNEEAQTADDLEYILVQPHSEVMRFWDQIYFDHFKDVEPIWHVDDLDVTESERDDEIDVEEDADVVTEDPEGEETVTEEPIECEEDDPDCDSASTAVGYTFLIVSLFYLLSEFHQKQLL